MSEDRKTITVASRVHTSFVMNEPQPKDYNVATSAPLRSHVINGARHPASASETGLTEGVDAGLFNAWINASQNVGAKNGGLVYEASPEHVTDLRNGVLEYGFEPGLKRAATEQDAPVSETTHGGLLSSEEMAAHSDTPNDDSPRSQTGQPA